ncbi:DNA modification methylase [Microbacterium sp. NPDC019599]|uniref:DNA modification methylase n=1 Tax=Microbacterium sp. NPDC019599 TaxID=3154690 RepID=UPI0033EC7F66
MHRSFAGAVATNRARLVSSLALGAVVLLGTTGCAMLSTQATTLPYSPSDGVNVPDSGPLEVRNALFVADESGEDANLIAAIVNSTDQAHTLELEIGETSPVTESIRVPANTTVSLGVTEDPLLVEGLGAKPGSDVLVYFQSGDAEGVEVAVPVLDGTLDYLAPFVP